MIVGTAGHIDHGKTALVRALTGVDTDRLKEEKARGITIDLGFAYCEGRDGRSIGFVDVPGHESLVRTMVAGAAGIDFALLVVAADEGPMPQTREHLAILDLLGIARGVVALTKCDRVDAARLAAAEREIVGLLAPTSFAAAPIVPTSVRSGIGIDRLRALLEEAVQAPREAPGDRLFRLAVDRAFTLKGAGTIVAGTAIAGRVAIGDEVTILPAGQRVRVRSLHVQNREAEVGHAGDRCALGLAGVSRKAVARGAWVCGEAVPSETARFDASLRVLASETRGLGQWTPVHLHCGASDVPARVVAISASTLAPGTSGFAQIVPAAPLPLRHGDRFVLRDTSAQRTIGGGRVVDPRAPLRRRRTPDRLQRLAAMTTDAPEAALARLLDSAPFYVDITAFAQDRGLDLSHTLVRATAAGLVVEGVRHAGFLLTGARRDAIDAALLDLLAAHHAANPELPGIAAERVRRALEPVPPAPLFVALRDRLLRERRVAISGHWLHLPAHVAQLDEQDKRIADQALPLIRQDRFRPPRVRDIGELIACHETQVRKACRALARKGDLVEIATDHFFLRETVDEMAGIAEDLTARAERGLFTAAAFRDRLDNGRKVAIQILEYFDRQGLTHRTGDLRRVVKRPATVLGEG